MNRIQALDQRCKGPALGAMRIVAGLMWLANLHWKVPGDFGRDNGGGLYKYIAAGAENAPLAPYRWMLREIVLPNYTLFGWFTLLSETVVAALLLIGWRSRLVALAGAALAVPIMLSVLYYPRADEWSWAYLMMIALHVVLWAVPSGDHLGVDGALTSAKRSARVVNTLGAVTVVVGLLGLFVARSVDFAGRSAALLGSDAGFVGDNGVVRRWELKFLWFNPMWALLTIAAGVLLLAARRMPWSAWLGAGLLAVMALAVLVQLRFDYLRDDGAVQRVATGSNVAVWGGVALAVVVLMRRVQATPADE